MNNPKLQQQLRRLPAIGELLSDPRLRHSTLPQNTLKRAAQAVVQHSREAILAGNNPSPRDDLTHQALELAAKIHKTNLRRVINGTGVVIHTNLGRAPLAPAQLAQALETAARYSNLEFDLEHGERGSRQVLIEPLLCELTGAEAALVVNNNAAAVMLALATLARGREVVISRGELIEIGGSFRIPDVLEQSGCVLREVGTTNRTRLSDYARAITPHTAVLMKVHPSNYRVVGFTEQTSLQELTALGKQRGIPVVEDLGSGCLIDLSNFGIPEPTAADRVRAGVDLVTMSGDKLAGGPQAGIMLGRAALIRSCRKHPLARALRIDKLSLAVLEATLRIYQEGTALEQIPVLRMLTRSSDDICNDAKMLQKQLQQLSPAISCTLVETCSRAGGGAAPELDLPTVAVELTVAGTKAMELETWLRGWKIPIIVRIQEGKVRVDPRTLLEGDWEEIVLAVGQIGKE